MNNRNDRQYLNELVGGFRLTQCIYVVAKLQISEILLPAPLKIGQIAKIANVHEEALCRVLRYLCAYNIFDEIEDGTFALNTLSEFLLANHEQSIRPMAILSGEEFYKATASLLYSTNTNKPCFNLVFGQDFWHYLSEHDESSQLFNEAMKKGSQAIIKKLLLSYDFSSANTITDVGGGYGHVVSSILLENINATGIVFDLPQIKDRCIDYLISKNLNNRCKFIGGDFLSGENLPRSDIYILKTIIHDWDDESCVKILKTCRSSMDTDSKLLIIDRVVSFDTKGCKTAYMWDIQMLSIHGGKERSISQFECLLEQANLQLINKTILDNELYLLEVAVKIV